MMRGKRLIAVGAVALVFGLVASFPARVAYQWFAPEQLLLSGISGSVWSGAAAQGSAAGIYISDLTWSFRPMSLFRLGAGYEVAAKLPSGFIESDVFVAVGGDLRFSRLSAAMPVASLNAALPASGISGDLSLQFDRLVLRGGLPTEADGTLGVSALVVRALSPTALGDYRATLQTDDDGISGTVEDLSGVIDLNGNVMLGQDRSYSFVGQVAANANAPAAVMEQLRFLGSPDAQGRREIRLEGSL